MIRLVPEEQDKPPVRTSLTIRMNRGRFRHEDLAHPHHEMMADHVSAALVLADPVSAVRKRIDLAIDQSAGRMPLIAVSSRLPGLELVASGRTPFCGSLPELKVQHQTPMFLPVLERIHRRQHDHRVSRSRAFNVHRTRIPSHVRFRMLVQVLAKHARRVESPVGVKPGPRAQNHREGQQHPMAKSRRVIIQEIPLVANAPRRPVVHHTVIMPRMPGEPCMHRISQSCLPCNCWPRGLPAN